MNRKGRMYVTEYIDDQIYTLDNTNSSYSAVNALLNRTPLGALVNQPHHQQHELSESCATTITYRWVPNFPQQVISDYDFDIVNNLGAGQTLESPVDFKHLNVILTGCDTSSKLHVEVVTLFQLVPVNLKISTYPTKYTKDYKDYSSAFQKLGADKHFVFKNATKQF